MNARVRGEIERVGAGQLQGALRAVGQAGVQLTSDHDLVEGGGEFLKAGQVECRAPGGAELADPWPM
jgi:hypothetical protein